MPDHQVDILPYTADRAADFRDINLEWIGEMFEVEPVDRRVLDDPEGEILRMGGEIWFASIPVRGVVGAGALKPSGGGGVELTKMGVRAGLRGTGVGRRLLEHLIARGRAMGADPLYLLTNRRCAAAIHLYEQSGFLHDADILARHGCGYARCDVAMRLASQDAAGAAG